MSSDRNQSRLKQSGAIWIRGALVGLAVLAGLFFGALDDLERLLLNAEFHLRGSVPPVTPIVVITIDEDSFDELDLQWPWPRALHGRLLDILSRGQPAAIGFDVIFAEPSALGPADDQALGAAIGRAGNVVLGAALTEVKTALYGKQDLNPPVPEIRQNAAGFGFVNFSQEEDAFIRATTLTLPFQDTSLPSFDLLLYRIGTQAGIRASPLPRQNLVYINFRGRPGTFAAVPYYQVLNGEVDPELFRGKIVLVGATSLILHDMYPTPFAIHGEMPGVEIHANVLETLFQGISLRPVPIWVTVFLTLAAGLFSVWLTRRPRPLPASIAVFVVALLYLDAAFGAFSLWYVSMNITAVPLTLLLGYGVTVVESLVQERREKRRLSRFFSPGVVAEIFRHKKDVDLGSERRRMTVLFSDIRGFTSMSEKMTPEEVVAFLREYMTVMTAAVFEQGGTVDKYIGDCIMALYNVPFDQPDHAEQAVKTGLAFQGLIRPMAERFRTKYGTELSCGVGIHTGDAVVGTIGSEQRLEYTAIGDTINLGSRLESITKDFKVAIVISEATYQEVQGKFLTRFLGEVRVKGKEIPVKIYTVLETPTRKEPRVSMAAMGAKARIIDQDTTLEAMVRDLSLGGLAVGMLPKEYPKGERLRLRLESPTVASPIEVTVKVAWSLEDKAGFEFLDLKPEDRKAIEEILGQPQPPADQK